MTPSQKEFNNALCDCSFTVLIRFVAEIIEYGKSIDVDFEPKLIKIAKRFGKKEAFALQVRGNLASAMRNIYIKFKPKKGTLAVYTTSDALREGIRRGLMYVDPYNSKGNVYNRYVIDGNIISRIVVKQVIKNDEEENIQDN